MLKIKLISSIVLVQFIIISCERQNDDSTNDYIIIGNNLKMKITQNPVSLEGSYYEPALYDIDLNSDGLGDFQLKSIIEGSTHFPKYNCSIESLNAEALLVTTKTIDTSFYCCSEVRIQQDYNGKVGVFYRDILYCSRSSNSDTIVSIQNKNIVRTKYYGDTIRKSDSCFVGTFEFNKGLKEYTENKLFENSDTIIYHVDDFQCYKYRIINNSIFFFGIKVKDKLGWIKLSVSGYSIYLFETAIQL